MLKLFNIFGNPSQCSNTKFFADIDDRLSYGSVILARINNSLYKCLLIQAKFQYDIYLMQSNI